MKKKSKILNKLITAMFVVFCVVLLSFPAFASDGTVILPETTFIYEEEFSGVFLEYSFPLIEGQKYTVVFNGISYSCFCWVQELDEGGLYYALGTTNIDNPDYPFIIFTCVDPELSSIVPLISDIKQGDTFTVAIYEEVLSPFGSIMGEVSTVVDSSIGWVGQFVYTIVAQPLLLCFCIVIFVGLGIGLIARIKK